jgi:multicomponent Na+:H+ antiporter subunit E
MNLLLLVLVLALGWTALTGSITAANLLLGAVLASAAVFLLRRSYASPVVLRKMRQSLALFLLFLRELLVSAVRVAMVVLSPKLRQTLRPAIVAFPLSVKSDAEITLLANLVTLTPGTLSVDVSDDRSVLYVHVLTMDTREAVIADIAGGFEARIRKLYS